MPRSGAIYTLPEAAFVPNTPISSAAVNSDFSDVADALTDSLTRNGQGGMTAVLPLDNTGFTYLTDPNTGMRRTAADEQAIRCGGVDMIEITSASATVNGDLEVTGALTIDGNPVDLIGEVKIWTSATIPPKWLLMDGSSLLRATYPQLWTFAAAEIAAGNTLFTNGNGTTTFTVGTMAGYAPVGVDTGGTTLPSVTHIGDTTGNKSVTLAANQIPSITSTVTTSTTATDLLGGTILNNSYLSGNSGSTQLIAVVSPGTMTSAFRGSTGTATSNNTGSTETPIVQPSRAFNFIIYAGA